MIKQLKTVLFALGMLLIVGSCQSTNQDARDEARDAVETSAAVTPQDATTPQQAVVPQGPTTEMSFDATTFDFGTVENGEMVSHVFEFKNTGNEPLVLQDAKGSCGCTVPKWPREPIAPGETGEILVEFNSKNKPGKRNQKVTITANTNPPQSFIYLTGEATGGAAPQNNTIQVQQ